MPEMICPFCLTQYPQDFKWCMEDGSELEADVGQYAKVDLAGDESKVPCPECGAPIDPRDQFCGTCGARLEGMAAPAEDYSQETYEDSYASAEPAADEGPTRPCPICDTPVGLTVTTCPGCGTTLEAATGGPDFSPGLACPHCAGPIDPGDEFCGTCGTTLGSGGASAPSPAPAASGDAKVCSCCGQTNDASAEFCANCGIDLS